MTSLEIAQMRADRADRVLALIATTRAAMQTEADAWAAAPDQPAEGQNTLEIFLGVLDGMAATFIDMKAQAEAEIG